MRSLVKTSVACVLSSFGNKLSLPITDVANFGRDLSLLLVSAEHSSLVRVGSRKFALMMACPVGSLSPSLHQHCVQAPLLLQEVLA